jgi:hypothetical protein
LREQKKRISRKEGESPRKKEIPLHLSYFSSLREQIRRGGLAKKGSSQGQDPFAALLLCAFA